jgi:hypothetical protein
MEPGAQAEMNGQGHFCPECGAEESGYFCRNCGALLRGEDLVLCPRCHQIVPGGEFCNQCGQTLSGIALNLRQLALAGDDFWVAATTSAPPSIAANDLESNLLAPDESVVLADAELPEWLQELPADSAPSEVQAHVYPSLRPIEETKRPAPRGRFVTLAFLLLGLLLLSLVLAVGVFLLRGG